MAFRPIHGAARAAGFCLLLLAAAGAAPLAAQSQRLYPDTAVYTGKLPNGLRYWIRHNSYPAHRLELRLVVHVGSIVETDDQRGLAHFIEHMAFNGTTHFARNDLVRYLESIGVRFGADLNAETSFDQTIYILPVPTDSAGVVPRAFDVLQDWAMGDRFDSSEVVAERGVVLGEWRSGLGAASRVRDKEFPVLFRGSRYASRLPIGDTAIIAHAEPSQLERFYHDWYRPDLMGIVAVGDFPVDSIRKLIESHFAAMRNPPHERPRVNAPVPELPGTRVSVITDSELTGTTVQLVVFVKPTDFKADQVLISADMPGGFSTVPDSLLLDAQLAIPFTVSGGAGSFDAPSLARRMAGKIAQVLPSADETSSDLIAVTAPKDIESALKLLWLRVTAPRYDSTAVAALQSAVHTQLANRDLAPTTILQDTITVVMGSHSPRAQPLSLARFEQADPKESVAIYRRFFSDFGDATFVIVGAVNIDSLRPLVIRWLGGLPATGHHVTWQDVKPRPPEGVVTRILHKGKEPVARQIVAFTGTPPSTDEAERLNADVAAEVLQQRLLDRLREAMGATYSVNVNVSIDRLPHAAYTSVIAFQSAPTQTDTLWSAAQQLIDSLRRDGPTADELQKVVAQEQQSTEVAVKTNDWWMQALGEYSAPDGDEAGAPLADILAWRQRLDAVTPASVRAAAQRYFDPARVARFILLPESTAP